MENEEIGENVAKKEGSPTFWQKLNEIVDDALSNGETVKMVVDTMLRIIVTFVLTELLTKKK